MNWWFFTRQKVFTRKVSSDSGVGVLDSATRCRRYWNNHLSDAFGFFFLFRVNCWFFANGLLFKPKIFLRFIFFMALCSFFNRKKGKNKAASFAKKKKQNKTIIMIQRQHILCHSWWNLTLEVLVFSKKKKVKPHTSQRPKRPKIILVPQHEACLLTLLLLPERDTSP